MAKKNISITHPKVLKAFEDATKEGRGSRLVEEAILYYLDSLDHDYITKEEVQSMLFDALRNVEIKNPNCSLEQIGDEMNDIFNI